MGIWLETCRGTKRLSWAAGVEASVVGGKKKQLMQRKAGEERQGDGGEKNVYSEVDVERQWKKQENRCKGAGKNAETSKEGWK